MANPKDVLVITTSSTSELKIKKHLKPVSAHIVAGTNLFSDFLGGLTDVFGGRSQSYQKQLTSLYNEAIERIKFAAYEIGANCVIGLNIDMDEISGKGKSMFMITAVGTAVILEKETTEKSPLPNTLEKFENVGVDRINVLRTKKDIVEKANAGTLELTEDVWSFISSNQVDEIFPYVIKKYSNTFTLEGAGNPTDFYKSLLTYIDMLLENKKISLLYDAIENEEHRKVAINLSEIVKELQLFDFHKVIQLIQSSNFQVQKRGLRVAMSDKAFYNKQDIQDLQSLRDSIKKTFVERGTRTTKKQLLSSKEKEVWICECKNSNDIGGNTYCTSCEKDIYGFGINEEKPSAVDTYLEQKIELITEFVE